MPRRARALIPAGLPHGRETAAACAVLVVLAHVLLAQLTFVLAVAFAVTTRLSRWRLWWLAGPAAAGLALTLATGPAHAAAGFAAGPAQVLGYLGQAPLIAGLAHPSGAFAGRGNWLLAQLPIALIAAAAEAGVLGWLDWVRTDEWALAPRRPGAIAAVRGTWAARMIGAGAVVTADGCALGVTSATGAIAELRWSQVAAGALVAGASATEATVTSLQVVHAALRRRKPLIVIDPYADASIARAVEAACRATGTPLRRSGIDLGRVIAERTAALVTPRSPEDATRACAELTALAADLSRIDVDGDALVWVPGGERLPAPSIAALIRAGGRAGLAVLVSTAWPAAGAELAGLVGALLIHRIADPALAAALAPRTGTRLLPPAEAAARAGMPPGGAAGRPAGVPAAASGMGQALPATGLVPHPAVTARTLLSLGPGEFVLAAVSPAGPARPEFGRLVPARLPRREAEAAEEARDARDAAAALRDRGDAGPGRRPREIGSFSPRGRS